MKPELRDIFVKSSIDGTDQPSLFHCPESSDGPVPLVVGLHPWSHDRHYPVAVTRYFDLALARGWALLLPEFRGPNLRRNPHVRDACGSRLARQDVVDAVLHVCANYPVDASRVFLLGCSGGGHMALLVAEDRPDLFRGVDVWCPVTDLARWFDHVSACGYGYREEIIACLGGTPAERPDEAAARSPATEIAALVKLPLYIRHGRHDKVVPFRHSVDLIRRIEALGPDTFFHEIFDGGHESVDAHSFEWFAALAGQGTANAAIGR